MACLCSCSSCRDPIDTRREERERAEAALLSFLDEDEDADADADADADGLDAKLSQPAPPPAPEAAEEEEQGGEEGEGAVAAGDVRTVTIIATRPEGAEVRICTAAIFGERSQFILKFVPRLCWQLIGFDEREP